MGILRFYLALCVVAAHSGTVFPWRMHDGKQAVQIFYIISGFYMAMVLSTRYATPKDFYVSRALRIFPPYWIALLGTVISFGFAGIFFHDWILLTPYMMHPFEHNGMTGVIMAALSNLTIVGQDWILFLSHDLAAPLKITANFWNDSSPLWKYLLLPQCWSIGVELTFYVLVPFLNRLNSYYLSIIAAGAIVAKLSCYWWLDLAHDPWNYRFFPFEISLFLYGMLGYRVYERLSRRYLIGKFDPKSRLTYMKKAAAVILILFIHIKLVDFTSKFVGVEIAPLLFFPIWILGLPMLFVVFGSQKEDRIIGELSYPIYLVHHTVIIFVIPILKHLSIMHGIGLTSAAISIGIAILFYRLFIHPLDIKRQLLSQTVEFNEKRACFGDIKLGANTQGGAQGPV